MKEAIQLLFRIEGVQRATLWPWDEKERCFHQMPLETRAGLDQLSAPMFDPQNLVLSSTILNQVRQHNRPLLIRDLEIVRIQPFEKHRARGDSGRVLLAGQLAGTHAGRAVRRQSDAADAFSQEDFQTFTIIAAQAGMALANSLAREELSRQDVERANLQPLPAAASGRI